MEKGHDYIPGANDKFTVWFDNLVSAVVLNTTGANPPWAHIPQEDVDALLTKQDEWHAAQDLAVSDPTSDNRKERNRVRTVTEKFARGFVDDYLRRKPVTDAQRDHIGVHNPDTTPSKIATPTTVALIYKIIGKRGQQVLIHFRDETQDKSRAIPYGYNGCILNYTYGPAKVTEKHLIKERILMTASPFLLTKLPEDAEGKVLSCYTQWQTEAGEEGPPSDIVTVRVI
jgi:hypothetical protein